MTPRLSVLLALEAPVGVIFRRGPTKVVRLYVWNRTTDRFKPGPVFRGRIGVERSDLSPDGQHMIYFAVGGVAWAIPATGGTWTAISQLPSLKASTLWGQGDTWGGGGWFTSNRSYWLELTANTVRLRDDSGLRREEYRPAKSRMERDGWVDRSEGVYEKTIREGWVLRKKGYSLGYELRHDGLSFPEWEWAEWEAERKRLVWAEDGCLRAAKVGAHKLGTVRTLYDFNE